MVEAFNQDFKEVNELVYRKLVKSLIYLTSTRIDLSYAVSFISRFMTSPKVEHWIATKRVLRYVKGTLDFGILYNRSKDPRLCGYTDSDWAGFVDDRKSTSRYVFNLGTGVVTWTSKKQHAVALSLIEVKYRGAVKEHVRQLAQEDAFIHEDVTDRANDPIL
jgi:hypothetical protein